MTNQESKKKELTELRQRADEAEREKALVSNTVLSLRCIIDMIKAFAPTLQTQSCDPVEALTELRHAVSRLHDVYWPIVANANSLRDQLSTLENQES